jgi:maltooligosyltrehalose trehalohydrolase
MSFCVGGTLVAVDPSGCHPPCPVDPLTDERKIPVGAHPVEGGVHFRAWAPGRHTVEVVLEGDREGAFPLRREEEGYHSATIPGAAPGTLYRYRLDGGDAYPDPASRFQPQGPHGPSEVVDPWSYSWSDDGWGGLELAGQVIYEMHVGTFTREGTWAAAARELASLAELGVTALEIMPVAEFHGRFGWGYDGVDLFAPSRLYGAPDDFRRFVDGAHALGLAVILDVVYNHLGPSGNYLREFSGSYFSRRHETEWGEAINFDGADAGPVREFFLSNAAYWIREFHLDGLRLDATQSIFDEGPRHIIGEIVEHARRAAGERRILVIGENEPQEVALVRAVDRGGQGLDTLWNDDYHHSAMVALTGGTEAYYGDHLGAPQELVSALKWGFLFQGQHYRWQGQRRGTPAFGLPPAAFVHFLQNHDQVANSADGRRLHQRTSPGSARALTALTLLGPQTPMLFQGQEFAASAPFLYFADHEPELARKVQEGRGEFLRQFRSIATPETESILPDPAHPETFDRCKLDHAERHRHPEVWALHRDLLRLRREDAAFRMQRAGGVDGAVLSHDAFVLRYFAGGTDERLVLVNLGRDLLFAPAPEPLLGPPAGMRWMIRWSSEHPRYGGGGTPPVETEEGWRIPGASAIVLAPAPEVERGRGGD